MDAVLSPVVANRHGIELAPDERMERMRHAESLARM